MTISADAEERASDVLARNFEMYRDLSLVLKERIAFIRDASGGDAGCKEAVEAAKACHKALQTVLDLEASLVTRRRAWTDAGGELDLAAAREEVLARLAAWDGEG
jgi:hypothetical protein